MTPKPIKIRIGGKTVTCRAIQDAKEILQKGDVSFDGLPVSPLLIGERAKYAMFYYRPLPSAKKRKAVKRESIKASLGIDGWLGASGQIIGGLDRKKIHKLTGQKFPTLPIEVTITLSTKGAKK